MESPNAQLAGPPAFAGDVGDATNPAGRQWAEPLALGGGVVQGGLSIFNAISQNKALEGQIEAAARAAEFQQASIAAQAGARLEENRTRMAQVRGRVRTQFQNGEGGQALIRQVAIDGERNRAAIALNQNFQTSALRRGYASQASAIASQSINPLLAAVSGVISGGITGLQLGSAIEDMTASRDALNNLRASGI